MSGYADTSFLASLYLPDANSPQAAGVMKRARLPILLTALGEVELTNALYLRVFRRELGAEQVHAAQAMFRGDVAEGIFQLKPLSRGVFEKAMLLSRKQTPRLGTRALDVLHVAAALVHQAETFYTFDRNQAKLAEGEGLQGRW
ncbi:MAG TPA: type II toxin-antitoxin system VapC family toxin [Candidatus Acidoferrales bacterium]|nr:type II toxin-antitoxin system VapC family toxin [Candidatus Acidoferrales bacterium]